MPDAGLRAMWEFVGDNVGALLVAVVSAMIARGSRDWRRLTTANHELELAAALGEGELAEALRAKGERSTQRYVQPPGVTPKQAAIASRTIVLLLGAVAALTIFIVGDVLGTERTSPYFVAGIMVGALSGFYSPDLARPLAKWISRPR